MQPRQRAIEHGEAGAAAARVKPIGLQVGSLAQPPPPAQDGGLDAGRP